MSSIPQIPPRPNKSHDQGSAKTSSNSLTANIPQIPPRPAKRGDRSASPSRESYAPSPLNEKPPSATQSKPSSLYRMNSANNSTSELPPRPPSVSLPSLGQEGSEYAEMFNNSEELGTSPAQTRNVANDLKLHAPKPDYPESSAKARVSAVTRTDSGQAAAYGIGKAGGDDKDPGSRSLKNKSSFASNASASGIDRPVSSNDNKHGIPEIGQQVPMYPNAGDVQAPSPSPFATPYAPGIGFHNDGSKPRHHERKISGRGGEQPPGSYGLHGHGIVPHDRFEKAYYEKHPELFKKETTSYHGPIGEGRAEWAMSSDDLNKIVRDTASRGAGLGTSRDVMSTPTEQVGFQASEEYASRMSSPRPQTGGFASQTHVDSPLRKESIPGDGLQKADLEGALSKSFGNDHALESEAEGEDTIHIDPPSRRSSRSGISRPQSVTGKEGDDLLEERGYNAPILASDEVAKEPFGYELQAAVSPPHERRNHDETGYHSSTPGSRATSRPGSIHGGNTSGIRLSESTPLEEVQEYEPLFPEDDKAGSVEKPTTAADRLKRPELKNRKFPSQDVWEDAPNSLHYTATVSAPQLPEEHDDASKPSEETTAQAFARRQEELAEQESSEKESFLHPEKKAWSHLPHLATETRPGLKQRFPSRDIWEDTPDSLQLQTTVSTPQTPAHDVSSPADEKPAQRPTTGAVVYHQEKAAAGFELGKDEGRATTGMGAIIKPAIPARPAKSKADSPSSPAIPDRPSQRTKQVGSSDEAGPPLPLKSKPQIPARPSRSATRESTENIPLAKARSNSSSKSIGSDGQSPVVAKAKPPVPSRPVGSKIAALQGGFMSDLNARLRLGPQAPKKDEPKPEEKVEEKEKVPLSDARKGRARGPARRAPAKAAAPATVAATEPTPIALVPSTPATTWYIDSDEVLHVAAETEAKSEVKTEDKVEETIPSETKTTDSSTPTLATNTAGESLHESTEIAPGAEKSASPPSAIEDAHAEQPEESQKKEVSAEASAEASGNDSEPVKASETTPAVTESKPESTAIPDETPVTETAASKDVVDDEHVE